MRNYNSLPNRNFIGRFRSQLTIPLDRPMAQ